MHLYFFHFISSRITRFFLFGIMKETSNLQYNTSGKKILSLMMKILMWQLITLDGQTVTKKWRQESIKEGPIYHLKIKLNLPERSTLQGYLTLSGVISSRTIWMVAGTNLRGKSATSQSSGGYNWKKIS